MKITVQSSGNLQRIGVLGRLESTTERVQLIHLLDQADPDYKHQIDVYDADTLPPEIIAAITRCLNRKVSLKIITYPARDAESKVERIMPPPE